MDIKNYIKVTPKGDTRSHVVLAANKAFYVKHGGKIEEPTEDEILSAFPELKSGLTVTGTLSRMTIYNGVVEEQLHAKDEQILKLIADREADADKIARLKAQCEELAGDLLKRQSEHEAALALVENLGSDLKAANETIEELKLKVEVATPAPKK